MRSTVSFSLFVMFSFLFSGCSQHVQNPVLLELIPPEKTGIFFSNEIHEDENLNILTFEYFYNGSGVGIGDFNNDGLPDLFFSSNMGKSRLYLNKGGLSFRDITDSSGINTLGKWASGVSVVDINQDGFDDIYVSFGGPYPAEKRANAFYVNNRNNTFTDRAQEYGLADTGHSVQAVFFDYDKDADLDMYLLTNITDETGPNIIRPKRNNSEMANTDRLYRNDSGRFTNVSKDAGITKEGYGLGVAVTDINEDGWPDIFVSNDYLSNDLLYINNRNGTFTDQASTAFRHTSYSAMGNDVADINNDGKPDIIEVDMLPPDNYRKKMMLGATNNERFRSEIQYGYAPQYMRNTLQLNRGLGPDGTPTFSEIAQLSGVAATDWSWSPLFADLDNDGWRDLVITNGYPRDITNRDFINYRAQDLMQAHQGESLPQKRFSALQQLDGALLHNFVYQYQKDLHFKDVSAAWGFTQNAYSNGAAYADLDNDGDLDLVMVNTGQPAFIYRNNADTLVHHHFLNISLQGPGGNIDGYGAKISLYADSLALFHEHYPVRGYQSTVEKSIHFGLGEKSRINSLVITWPDGKMQSLKNIQADQPLLLNYANSGMPGKQVRVESGIVFNTANHTYGINFQHKETPYTDFNIQPLLPHKFSQSGAGIAVGDINGDGLEDFFAGGAYNQSGQVFMQQANGGFKAKALVEGKKPEEDMGVLLFDADNDKDLDLYIVSGGNEYAAGSKYYQDRLYKNDGLGVFTLDPTALPVETASGSCVVATDFDGDGDLDLFVGGQITPQHYPESGRSFLLENKGGRFIEVTDKRAPGLKNTGMVNAAIWSDFNNDTKPDLVIAGEWMPITVFMNNGNQLINVTKELGLEKTIGWWNSIQGGDFNGDGQTDFIVGNLGTNSRYTTSDLSPLQIYLHDFSNTGHREAIITYTENGVSYPIHPRDDLMQQLPGLRKKFPLYADYAKAGIKDLFSPELLQQAVTIRANTFQTVQLQNNGNKPWFIKALCVEAQFAPVFGIMANDYDGDGVEDVLLSGNFYGAEVINGQYDAFKGLFLKGIGNGDFKVTENGFRVEGDGKGLAEILTKKNNPLVLAALNNDSMVVLEHKAGNVHQILKAGADDAYAIIRMKNGRSYRKELYYGSGYLSAPGRYLYIPKNAAQVEVYTYNGVKRKLVF
ncbi:VCBS repeat-containing protein [Flavihumibacter fluvii]|uniref:VCBS repeat-containing protein n=1 Tax=Flavihumibacter fluvii TaxID=2838157 RepID=UPI001BDE2B46|nr:VCBS repeat-containing protein [Flavihumibacter fluvii]ULQ53276.1 VCBS repeat-containing protein [Flavihumibacter fluvii]